jgi:BirA family biotin operon repressor/biotin-[acetyl-CoA-carboxylase] ligase
MDEGRSGAAATVPRSFVDAVARHRDHPWADAPVVFLEETTSTNDIALELAAHGAVEGTSVVALSQTAGRGRRGRSWTSPQGAGIYFTVVLRPATHADSSHAGTPSRLTLLAAVAIADAVESASGLSPQIKWPNDLVVDAGRDPATGAWRRRKLAGILTEATVAGAELQHVVVGVGLNLAPTAYPPDVIAASILSETSRPVSAADVFAACRASLAREYTRWARGGWDEVLDRWRVRSPSSTGYRVTWSEGGRSMTGVTAGLDADGALRIDDRHGHTHRVVAGEVEWT